MEKSMVPPPPTAVKEIEIFTVEQLNVLPEEARVSIINLESNLPQKELLVLNPLVSELLKIKELTKIKYVPLPESPTKEDITAHKENIEEFKAAKKSIIALTQQNAKAKSAIKGPLDLLGKQVLTIEKSVKAIADEVLSVIEESFKPYLDAEAKKKADALALKEQKEKEAINALSEQNQAQANMYNKSVLVTYLKYEMLSDTKREVNNAIENYSLDALFSIRDMLSLKTFEQYTNGKDLSLLEVQELQDIKDAFAKEIELFRNNINIKIEALQLAKDNEKLIEAIAPVPPTPISTTSVFEKINDPSGTPYGQGANMNTVPIDIYPKNPNDVDFLDLVIDQLKGCKENVQYICSRFATTEEINKTAQDLENIRRVENSSKLIDKIISYVLGNDIPPKQ